MSVLKTYGDDITSFKPSKTYRLTGDRVEGKADGKAAMQQAIDLVLSTERWRHLIYSGDYGMELDELFGKSRPYVAADLERRIREALLEDDRITAVENFEISFSGDTATASCTAVTLFGDVNIERSVSLG
ncbi:MAG TPA: DUF2634 domain-containing protein [Clostridia bacterium]|nr:DUF2634 domain-containing protein [Clostridia bacterium]